MENLAKYRSLAVWLYTSSDFPCKVEYDQIRDFLVQLRLAIKSKLSTHNGRSYLMLLFVDLPAGTILKREEQTTMQRLERHKLLQPTLDTLFWIVEDIERFDVFTMLMIDNSHFFKLSPQDDPNEVAYGMRDIRNRHGSSGHTQIIQTIVEEVNVLADELIEGEAEENEEAEEDEADE